MKAKTTTINNVTINGETFQLPDNIVGAVMFAANGTVNAWSTEQYNMADRAQAARAELLTTIMELQIQHAQLVSKDMQPHTLSLDEKNRKIAELSAKVTSSQDIVRQLTRELEDLLKRVPNVRSLPQPDRVKDIVDAFRDLDETELDDLGKRLDATAYGDDWKMRLISQLMITYENIAFINAASAHFGQLMDVIQAQQAELERQQKQLEWMEDSRDRYYGLLKELRDRNDLSADDECTFDRLGME